MPDSSSKVCSKSFKFNISKIYLNLKATPMEESGVSKAICASAMNKLLLISVVKFIPTCGSKFIDESSNILLFIEKASSVMFFKLISILLIAYFLKKGCINDTPFLNLN